MAKIDRFNGNIVPFAKNATGNNRSVFGNVGEQSDVLDDNLNADFISGWEGGLINDGTNDYPPMRFFNALGFTQTALTAHLYQAGISEFHEEQEYFINSVCMSNGLAYKSLVGTAETPSVGNEPTGSEDTNWELLNKSDIDSIASLKTVSNISTLNVLGYYAKGDGGGGQFYWDSESIEDDNGGTIIQATGVVTGRWKRVFSGAVNVKWFGAVGDGVTDDIVAMQLLSNITDDIDGNGNTFVVNTNTYISLVTKCIKNCNFITNGVLFNHSGLVDFNVINCNFEGNRGTFTEQWDKFSSYNGIDSIQPSLGRLIKNNIFTTKEILIENCSFNNMFNESCLTLNSYSNVFIDKCSFNNIANKTYHIWHEYNGRGKTIASNIIVNNIGILPDSFSYYNGTTTTTVTWGSIGMPMPQGSFGNIVTYGTYIASNIQVHDYATTAVTFDRNTNAMSSDIIIKCDNIKAVSNNPSGGLWNEFCGSFITSNVDINIVNRGVGAGFSSAIQSATKVLSDNMFTNITVKTSSTSNTSRAFINSSNGNSITKISNLTINDSVSSGEGFFYNYISAATVKDKLSISNSNISTYKLSIAPCSVLNIENSTINYTYAVGIFNYDVGVTGISNLQEIVNVSNTVFSGSIFKNTFILGKAYFNNCNFAGGFTTDARIEMLKIANSRIEGMLLCIKNYSLDLVSNTITKRVDIQANGVNGTQICNITGNTIGNNEAAYTLGINSSPIAGSVSGNTLLLYTGVVGGGYVNAPANVTITGNNQKQVTYVL